MSYNRRSGGSGGFGGGNFGNAYGPNGNNFSGAGNFGNGGGNFNGNGGGGHFNNYGRNPKMSPWESGVSPGGGMMPNVHPNQMALANDLISKLLSSPNQGGFGGGPNWGPNPGMVRRPESFKNQNRRRPDNRNRKPPPKKDDKKKDSKPEADKNNQSNEANGIKKEKADHEHVDYDGIPTAVLFCHVCQKHMWDGASFEKHVRGRPHELMMTYLDEGYKMQVELMRHQIKAAENQREIDLERMQAQNKGKAKPLFRNYCPMCNINFYGPLTGHRKSDRHRKLKQFLHPECKMCDTLFHTRLEWDDHKLSADHLRKVGEQRRQFNPDLKDDEFELLDVIIIDDNEEDLPIISQAQMLQDQEIKEEVDNQEEQVQVVAQVKPEDNEDENQLEAVDDVDKVEENVIKKDNTVEEENDLKEEENDVKEENDIKKEENGNAKEDASIIKKEKDEKYNPANVVGRELVVKTGGFVCRLCSVFMKNAEEAELHCQTATHYINFTSITKLHAKINNRKRKMKEEKKENEGDEDENKEATADPPGKRSCVDNNIEDIKPVVEVVKQNGTEEPEITNTDDNEAQQDIIEEKQEVSEVQETKLEVPVTEEPKDVSAETNIAETESAEESNSPVGKTTPTRGRGRGRGATARRGRSARS